MNHKSTSAALLLGALLFAGGAFADCPGPFVRDMKRAYENAKAAEGQGKKEDALFFYHGAGGSVCEKSNPYEADAAKRAAPLGLELGAAAEKRGDFAKAVQLYEAGGHFATADRVFMQTIRPKADEPGAYKSASEHFNNRREAWFAENNAAALEATGAYTPDPKLIAEVNAMPAKGIEHAYQKEAANFNEDFLREYVQMTQARPDDPSDANAIQRMIGARQAFLQKWKRDDFMKTSRDALQTLRTWSVAVRDKKLADTVTARVAQISEQRATTLRQKYSGAPQLLRDAMDYYHLPTSDNSTAEPKVTAVRAQALKLGDEANAKNRYELAGSYYDVAGADAKAEAVRERGRQVAMQKMRPSIDQMRQQADAMRKQFSDPAKVAEMRKQAEALRKSMQEQQAGAKAGNRKAAGDLEKELGL
ncbi:MAG: hypothetical protein WDO68_15740 [Gammaproteobacteria bacterium]